MKRLYELIIRKLLGWYINPILARLERLERISTVPSESDNVGQRPRDAWSRLDEQQGWIDDHMRYINEHMGYINRLSQRMDVFDYKHRKLANLSGFPQAMANYDSLVTVSAEQADSEVEFIRKRRNTYDWLLNAVNNQVQLYYRTAPLFESIEFDIINRCNGECEFCPVNKRDDPRKPLKMPEVLFRKIIDELRGLDYRGRLCFYSNNEPLLDSRIYEWIEYAREGLPKAWLKINTNCSLLDLEKFARLARSLDELTLDNYTEDLELTPINQEIAQYCEANPWLKRKVQINRVSPKAIRNTRGSRAPNRAASEGLGAMADEVSCLLPFTNMVIRADGKLSLCCCDALGEFTLGDISRQTLVEAWYGEPYRQVREKIYKGRRQLKICENCDSF
jgi:hypothetical protein